MASIQKRIKRNRTKKKTLKFRTTLQCHGCGRKVEPHPDEIRQIESLDVQLKNPGKVFKVVVPAGSEDEVSREFITNIGKEGYEAERLN